MAETTDLMSRITQVTQKDDGFKLEGYENWFNLAKFYKGPRPIPPAGSEVKIIYAPWTGNDQVTRFYVNSLSLPGVHDAAPPAPAAAPAPGARSPSFRLPTHRRSRVVRRPDCGDEDR